MRELGPREVAHLNCMFFLILHTLIITHLKKRSLSNDGVSKCEMILSLADLRRVVKTTTASWCYSGKKIVIIHYFSSC